MTNIDRHVGPGPAHMDTSCPRAHPWAQETPSLVASYDMDVHW